MDTSVPLLFFSHLNSDLIHVIQELQCSPESKDGAKTTWHVCSISPESEILEFDLGVDRKKLIEVLSQGMLSKLKFCYCSQKCSQ